MGAGPAFRFTRAAIFAVVCVAVSGLGHALRSEAPLPRPALALALVVAGGAGWWLAGRERGVLAIAGASAVGQLTLHTLFSWTHTFPRLTGAAPAIGVPGEGRSGSAMAHAHSGMSEAPPDVMAQALAYDGHSLTSGMAVAHFVAGLLCGWWLWRGESAVLQLGRTLTLFVAAPLLLAWRVLTGTGFAPTRTRIRTPGRPRRGPRPPVVLGGITRRGPPVLPSLR
ncbi:hypothetical protein ACFRMN_12200 [Streptomyces sp. NPDC056835]|uniref:hypothetical protein n=1 Tax=Streptomyces sp. NPDC056835 TaxID=3345956 RepID=UPI0036CDF273